MFKKNYEISRETKDNIVFIMNPLQLEIIKSIKPNNSYNPYHKYLVIKHELDNLKRIYLEKSINRFYHK